MNPRSTSTHLSRISTNWELLFQAHGSSAEAASEAQRRLMARYGGAVFHYLLAAVDDAHAAEDLAQEFALRFVRGDFRRADPERGRFRDFVKRSLYHLIVDHYRGKQSQPKPLPSLALRAGGAGATETVPDPGDEEFIRHWRAELLDRAWEGLAEVQARTGQLFHTVLSWRVAHPEAPAAELAERLGREMGRTFTDGGIRQTLRRAREKFADLLLEEVVRSLGPEAEARLEEEVVDLGLLSYCRPALERRKRGKG